MRTFSPGSVLKQCRLMLREIVAERGLDRAEVRVHAKPLSAEEAIGTPGRRDFPIVEGKERMIEAVVQGARGQAFTDSPSDFTGAIADVLALPFTDNRSRAVFVASLNAIVRYAGLVGGTVHCKDDDPETCAREIAVFARASEAKSVGLIGLNPAIAEALVREFGSASVRIADLNRSNINQKKFGVEVWDGRCRTGEMIRASDLVLITGTTLVNGTFDSLWELSRQAGKMAVIYGVTAAGASLLVNLPRLCPCARS